MVIRAGSTRADNIVGTPSATDTFTYFRRSDGTSREATIKSGTVALTASGTFAANGTSTVTVNATVAAADEIVITLNTANGTVGAIPSVKAKNASNFTVSGTALDTSTYNYRVWRLS